MTYREVTEIKRVYKFETAPSEIKEKIRDYFYFNFDLYEHSMNDRIETLKALAKEIDARLDYSLSCVPDRGEFISFYHDSDQINVDHLNADDCPLTGVCYDADVIEDIQKHGINQAVTNYINSIHEEYRSMLEVDYLTELCEANGYEFTEDGKLY